MCPRHPPPTVLRLCLCICRPVHGNLTARPAAPSPTACPMRAKVPPMAGRRPTRCRHGTGGKVGTGRGPRRYPCRTPGPPPGPEGPAYEVRTKRPPARHRRRGRPARAGVGDVPVASNHQCRPSARSSAHPHDPPGTRPSAFLGRPVSTRVGSGAVRERPVAVRPTSQAVERPTDGLDRASSTAARFRAERTGRGDRGVPGGGGVGQFDGEPSGERPGGAATAAGPANDALACKQHAEAPPRTPPTRGKRLTPGSRTPLSARRWRRPTSTGFT